MILSVLGGEDYPLAATRVGSDAPVIIDVGSNCGAAAVFKNTIPAHGSFATSLRPLSC